MVSFVSFHHPDWSLPVARRKVGNELLQMVAGLGAVLATRRWAWHADWWYDSRQSYRTAIWRLRKKRLMVQKRGAGKTPRLQLTPQGETRRPPSFNPERLWRKRWSGIGYLLSYDIPERDRPYHDKRRALLKRMRMGCLHKSLWVSPHDIRPHYDDLAEAAGLSGFAFLFEGRTVLGRGRKKW